MKLVAGKRKLTNKCKYICEYPTSSCVLSYRGKRCCWECNVREGCKFACLNSPEKCGATQDTEV